MSCRSEYGTLANGSCNFSAGNGDPEQQQRHGRERKCAQYPRVATDHVFNQAIFTSPNVVKVDKTAPTGGAISVTAGPTTTGTVQVSVTNATDPESGMLSNQVERKLATLTAGELPLNWDANWSNVTLWSGNDTVAGGKCARTSWWRPTTQGWSRPTGRPGTRHLEPAGDDAVGDEVELEPS